MPTWEEVRTRLDAMTPAGFRHRESVFEFVRVRAAGGERIQLDFSSPHALRVLFCRAAMFITSVEDPLRKACELYNLHDPFSDPTIQVSIVPQEYAELIFSTISDSEALEAVLVQLEWLIQEYALPFFDCFQDFSALHTAIEGMPAAERQKFIRDPLGLKLLLLKRLANAADFPQALQERSVFFAEIFDRKRESLGYDRVFHELFADDMKRLGIYDAFVERATQCIGPGRYVPPEGPERVVWPFDVAVHIIGGLQGFCERQRMKVRRNRVQIVFVNEHVQLVICRVQGERGEYLDQCGIYVEALDGIERRYLLRFEAAMALRGVTFDPRPLPLDPEQLVVNEYCNYVESIERYFPEVLLGDFSNVPC